MRKLVTISLCLLLPLLTQAQVGHLQLSLSTNFGPNNSNKPAEVSFIPNADLKVAYLFHLGNVFQLGAGVGVGMSTFTSFETEGVVTGEGPVHNFRTQMSPSVPIFAVSKLNIFNRPNTPFIKVEGGYRLAWADDSYKGRFNPYTFNVIPSIGYELAVGSHKLGVELGAEFMGYKKTYQPPKSDYLLDGGFLNITANNFNGVYFAVSFAF